MVFAVGHEQPSFGIEGQGVGRRKLAGGGPFLSPRLDKLPVFRQLHDPRVRISAMSVADENVAVRSDGHRRRPIESVRTVASHSRLAKRHQHLSIRAELEDLVALSVASLGVSYPYAPIPIHEDTVRNHEQSSAEALHQLAGRVEFEDGRFGMAGATVS